MRIAIVNDLPIAVELLRRIIVSTTQHEVAWIATNGAEAVAACRRDTPDLVLMDLTMPEMDGIEATRRIMAETPCPILLVIASIDSNVPGVFEAMGYGALDAVDLPAVGQAGALSPAASQLLLKITTIGKLSGDHRIARIRRQPVQPVLPALPRKLVAIGASAGGPGAVATLLSGLPADFPAGLILVQHVDEKFAPGLADWLQQHSALPVRTIAAGDAPKAGTLLIAATSDHLVFRSPNELGYTPEPKSYPYRPSVDVFFESATRKWRGELLGVLLTGMGRDGAAGLKSMRDKGYFTIAQDAASSAVYGMPKAAAAVGAAREILPLDSISRRITELCMPSP